MKRKIGGNLIYVYTDKHTGEKEYKINDVRMTLEPVFASKYYAAYQNDLKLAFVIRIRDHYRTLNHLNNLANFEDYQLRKVVINEKTYNIEKISETSSHFLLLDVSEL